MTHQWTTLLLGGDPTEASSAERVTFCADCGEEQTDDNRTDKCEPLPEMEMQYCVACFGGVDASGRRCVFCGGSGAVAVERGHV